MDETMGPIGFMPGALFVPDRLFAELDVALRKRVGRWGSTTRWAAFVAATVTAVAAFCWAVAYFGQMVDSYFGGVK